MTQPTERDKAAPAAEPATSRLVGKSVPWETVLERFASGVRTAYGSRIHRIVLYGSRARGDADAESDVDVLVVLDDCADFWTEHRLIGDIAHRASTDAETIVSAMPVGRRDFDDRRSPLLVNVRREGISVE